MQEQLNTTCFESAFIRNALQADRELCNEKLVHYSSAGAKSKVFNEPKLAKSPFTTALLYSSWITANYQK